MSSIDGALGRGICIALGFVWPLDHCLIPQCLATSLPLVILGIPCSNAHAKQKCVVSWNLPTPNAVAFSSGISHDTRSLIAIEDPEG